MKAVAVIPARYASTRLNGKPLADICGKPMIERVYAVAKAARLLNDVIVATDDVRILKAVVAFGGKAVMTSVDHASGTDRIAEAIKEVEADIVVNLQGDEPTIEPEAIDAAIRPLLDDPAIDVATLKTEITVESEYLDPNVVKVVTDNDGFALCFSRSPLPYYRDGFKKKTISPYKHIGLYVYRRAFLIEFAALPPSALELSERLEQMRALENGARIRVVETGANPVSVDTPEDLEKVRRIIKGIEK